MSIERAGQDPIEISSPQLPYEVAELTRRALHDSLTDGATTSSYDDVDTERRVKLQEAYAVSIAQLRESIFAITQVTRPSSETESLRALLSTDVTEQHELVDVDLGRSLLRRWIDATGEEYFATLHPQTQRRLMWLSGYEIQDANQMATLGDLVARYEDPLSRAKAEKKVLDSIAGLILSAADEKNNPEPAQVKAPKVKKVSPKKISATRAVRPEQQRVSHENLTFDAFATAIRPPRNWQNSPEFLNIFDKMVVQEIDESVPNREYRQQLKEMLQLPLSPTIAGQEVAGIARQDVLDYIDAQTATYPGGLVHANQNGLKTNDIAGYRIWLTLRSLQLFAKERMTVDQIVDEHFSRAQEKEVKLLLKGGLVEVLRTRRMHDKRNKYRLPG